MSWIKQFGPRPIPLLPHSVGTLAYIYGTRRLMGYPLKNRLIIFDRGSSTAYEWSGDIEKINKILLRRANNNPKIIWQISRRYGKVIKLSKKFTSRVREKNLKEMSDLELLKIIRTYLQKFYQCNYGPMARRIDETITPLVTDYLKTIARNREEVADYTRILLISPVETIIAKEQQEFLKLALSALTNKAIQDIKFPDRSTKEIVKIILELPKLYKLLKRHHRLFCWMTVYWSMDEPLTERYFLNNLAKILKYKTRVDIKKELREISQRPLTLKNKRLTLLNKLNLAKKIKNLANIVNEFSKIKSIHPDDLAYTQYNLLGFYQEIAKRADLSFQELKYLSIEEIMKFLQNKKLPSLRIIKSRQNYCVLLARKGKIKVFHGEQAKQIVRFEVGLEIFEHKKELHGFPASKGFTRGKVIVVTKISDLNKMQDGYILVAAQTNPNYLPAMKQAAAIITDEGGITSHAAIVSRELGIPSVIGTKIATKVLRDGDMVEVDAEQGMVRILKKSNY